MIVNKQIISKGPLSGFSVKESKERGSVRNGCIRIKKIKAVIINADFFFSVCSGIIIRRNACHNELGSLAHNAST
jgi:hypothetical protein